MGLIILIVILTIFMIVENKTDDIDFETLYN